MDGRGLEHVQEYILRQFRLTRQQVIPELLVRFVQRHPTPPPQTPTPAPTPTHLREIMQLQQQCMHFITSPAVKKRAVLSPRVRSLLNCPLLNMHSTQSVTYSISNHHMVLTLLYTALGAVVVPRKQPKV